MKSTRFVMLIILVLAFIEASQTIQAGQEAGDPVQRIELLPPGKDNPRNSEGDFVRLSDGRIMLIYTHFTGGRSDHATAYLAARFSSDGGRNWTDEDVKVVSNHADMNIMSVSLLRLRDGRIALFYLVKNSLHDCRPVMRTSSDEGETWSEPAGIIPGQDVGYYVMNNDRVVQLESGRLVAPVARHHGPSWEKWTAYGRVSCYLSDDGGRSWRRSKTVLTGKKEEGTRVMLQEPGVVELDDGTLMMFSRTNAGRQYVSYSEDGGETWSAVRASDIVSPRSPASIERIPSTGDLLMVWNNHESVPASLKGKRTPLTVAISRDEGKSWGNARTLYDDPKGWYCYTAIHFADERVLLAHCAGHEHLAQTNITSFPVTWLYR